MKKYALSNEITVIEDSITDAQSFTIFVMFRTGSRNETPEIWGISHFLEHMAFKGTKSYPDAASLAKKLDSLGAIYNAFTSKEHTGYYIKASKNVQGEAIKIIAEMTTDPIVLDSEVDKERGTIIEELNMYEDDPRRKISDFFEQSIYENKQISQDIVGSKESLAGIHAKEIIEYREKYYRSGNAVITVSGYIPENLNSLLESAFAPMATGKTENLSAVLEPKKPVNLYYKETQQTHMAIGFPGLDIHSDEVAVARVLATILGGNMSSRMFSEVREKRGLAYYVKTYADSMDDAGCLVTFAGVNNEKALEAVKIICDVYDGAKLEVPAEELRKTKDYAIGMMTLAYEDSEQRSESNATAELYGEEAKTLEQKIAEVEAVTAEQVVSLANRLFDDKKICVAVIGPFKNEADFAKIIGI